MNTATIALIRKDLLSEWRNRDAVIGAVAFAALVLIVFNFAFDLRAESVAAIGPGMLWMTFSFAGMLSIGRSFTIERERGTLDALLLAPIDRSAIFSAKLVTNIAIMVVVEIVAFPVFALLYSVTISWGWAILVIGLGTIGFAGVGTLIAALTATARARDLLLPLLLLPIQVPVVIASVGALAEALAPATPGSPPWWQLLLGFDVCLLAASYIVFEYVIDD
jgi:heme exporter protein B